MKTNLKEKKLWYPIIDKVSGAIKLNDGFSFGPDTLEEELAKHFNVPLQPKPEREKDATLYFLSDAEIGDWKVNLSLSFYRGRLGSLFMYPQISAELFPNLNPERTGYGPSELEYAVLDIYENWLTEQLNEQREFTWGVIEALFAKRPDGPGAPLISLVY
ncbi:hypothetical protein [Fluviicola taffensis]|uniref:Uncharacterized protein n=1 Tax=Fluviicola taffensis (strain DSM 16823 / NCIMB 13979 / RW262) TaxID=755732 RepID=F2IEL6_FLUTR|nr:hypothetical protein [Fluviicola taffensis]AEA44555.1 hypothetical protein Fluta_2571 [Fluviicola taffensis DSM 16823]